YQLEKDVIVRGHEDDINEIREIAGLRNRFVETAFWNARVVTDATGHASAEFTLPDSLTEWRIAALGVTQDTLAGAADTSLTASKPFLVELKTPALLQQGDKVTLLATARNNTDKPLKATLSLQIQLSTG